MRYISTYGFVLISCVVSSATLAGGISWPSGDYPYIVLDQDLRSVLRQFEMNTGIHLRLSDRVRGRVKGALPQNGAKAFLDGLADRFDLDWIYDGDGLAINARSERETKVISLGGVSFSVLRQELVRSELLDQRYELLPIENGNALSVTAPPAYADVVAQTLHRLGGAAPRLAEGGKGRGLVIMRGGATSHKIFP